MKLELIEYDNLNAKQKEIYNFQKVAALLAGYGFNCIKLDDDWGGADFLAYHKDGDNTLKVQLKGRLTISKKYEGKDIYMTFPIDKQWYMIHHEELVQLISEATNWLNTESWLQENGSYSSQSPSKKLLELIAHGKL